MAFITYSRRGEKCPVCQNLKRKDCRQNTNNGMAHCRDLSASPIDWIFRGNDKRGFGMWQHQSEAKAWSKLKSEERRQRRLEERDRIRKEKQKQKEFALSIEERDRTIK